MVWKGNIWMETVILPFPGLSCSRVISQVVDRVLKSSRLLVTSQVQSGRRAMEGTL